MLLPVLVLVLIQQMLLLLMLILQMLLLLVLIQQILLLLMLLQVLMLLMWMLLLSLHHRPPLQALAEQGSKCSRWGLC
jgi:hypothetical protein